ncbi:MAG: hypothetical protein FJ333_11335 [Sphingomonadales bacterium]|nr:hypothetical protein [Sphingomonadales bacterium]
MVKEAALTNWNLTEDERADIVKWVNFSKADSTWSAYRTAHRMLLKCQADRKKIFEWPLSKEAILIFIHWLITKRGLKSATVGHYLSGIRQAHIAKGMEPPVIRTEMVKQILKGRRNMEGTGQTSQGSKRRAAMTTAVMKRLKNKIRGSELETGEKLMLWSVCTLAFFGAFRIHELLSKHESTFDPAHTLLGEDISMTGDTGKRILSVRLKCPKERIAGRPTVVDVFEVGGDLCPLRAWEKWQGRREKTNGYPVFTWANSRPLTGRKLNSIMKRLLDKQGKKGGKYSTHSFRSGIPTIMGELGHSDEDIKKVGRWSSRAFNLYIKGSRTQRWKIAREIAKM